MPQTSALCASVKVAVRITQYCTTPTYAVVTLLLDHCGMSHCVSRTCLLGSLGLGLVRRFLGAQDRKELDSWNPAVWLQSWINV